MRSEMPRRVAESRWNGLRPRVVWLGLMVVLLPMLRGVASSAIPVARPVPSSAATSDDEACEEKFERIRKKFNKEKSKSTANETYLRVPTIISFGSAPCGKTIDFLKSLYKKEKNPGIFLAISEALIGMATKESIEAAVKVGLVHFVSQGRIDGFVLEQIARPS